MDAGKISLNKVCKDRGIRHVAYSSCPDAVRKLGLDTSKEPGGAFVMEDGTPVILYDNSMTPLEIQFTVAHELGHILLGHLNYRKSVRDRYPDFAEAEANYFAVAVIVHNLICEYGKEVLS